MLNVIAVKTLNYTHKLKEIRHIFKINMIGLKFLIERRQTSWLFTSMAE